jgi:REP element-mobilizing transposase RayT
MFRISKDSPVYYLTSVAHDRLSVFQTARLKELLCKALNEARTSARLLIFAYVIMPDHLHALIGQRRPLEDEPLLDIDQINWHSSGGAASKR